MIFLDMDGVIADLTWSMYHAWAPYLHGWHKAYPYDAEWRSQNKTVEPEFHSWYTNKERWTKGPILYPEFWRGIEPFPWTRNLVKSLGEFHICSNPGREGFSPAAASGKHLWCKAHLDLKAKNIILTADKWLLAAPGRVPIDDDEDYIKTWVEHGGIGILFPQPWNAAHAWQSADPTSYIQMKLHEVGYIKPAGETENEKLLGLR